MFESVYKCMQVVGVNSYDKQHMFEKYLREAACFPIYDGGNMGMQRRRVHGILASADFNPRALMDDEYVEFDKSMERIDTLPSRAAHPRCTGWDGRSSPPARRRAPRAAAAPA